MRSVALFAALAGAATAIDGLHWPRHFKATGTSVSVSSSSGSIAPLPPSGHPSSLPGNPHPTSYSTPWSGIPSSVATGSSKPSSYPWSSVIVPSGTVGTSTSTITTITTTTVCPVTQTSGTKVITTLTTSTITITSCKGGCHPSTLPTPPSTPTGPSSIIVPTVLTTGTWTFIPQSSSVGNNGHSTVYSTYLTSSYVTKTYSTELTVYPTSSVIIPPVVTPPSGSCPAPATVTVTVTEGPAPPTNCPECTKTYTITESGTTTCITVTSYPATTTTTATIETGTGHPVPPHHSTGTAPYSWSGTSKVGPKPTSAVWAW